MAINLNMISFTLKNTLLSQCVHPKGVEQSQKLGNSKTLLWQIIYNIIYIISYYIPNTYTPTFSYIIIDDNFHSSVYS